MLSDSLILTQSPPLKTAILLLVFNRLDTTKEVFNAIRQARPAKLYIAADGARKTHHDEHKQVTAVREYIMGNLDWDCEVQTLFREQNLGCKKAVSSAITWFFENEEMGIILEDDCLPNHSFFWFCEELLAKYYSDTRVGQICGFNPLLKFDFNQASYGFSKFGPIWGWASWRRAWAQYDVQMKSWEVIKQESQVDFFTDGLLEKKWRLQLFEMAHSKMIDTWDYQWSYAKLLENQLSIIPNVNLIKNIGFGENATHTKNVPQKDFLITFEMKDLKHPKFFLRNKFFDKRYLKIFVGLSWSKFVKQKVIYVLKRIFHV